MRAESLVSASFMAALVAALAIVCASWLRYFEGYYAATVNDYDGSILRGIYPFLCSVGAWFFSVALAVFAIVIARFERQALSAVRFGLTLIVLAASPVAFFTQGPGAVWHLAGFCDGMQTQNINYEIIRQWRLSLIVADYQFVPEIDWPPEIADLRPAHVMTLPGSRTSLVYGGGFGRWGIVVYAAKNVEDGSWTPMRFTVAPGVDAWYSE